jgi:hypothetical protein
VRELDAHLSELTAKKLLKLMIQMEQVLFDSTEVQPPENPRSKIPLGLEDQHLVVDSTLVSLRPHVDFFLEKLRPLYELSIFSQSPQNFVSAVLARIDSDDRYFGQRILRERKSDRLTIILDLPTDAWRESGGGQPAGYVQISPYFCFHHDHHPQIFPLLPTFSESVMASRPDNILPHVAAFLARIHQIYYGNEAFTVLDAVELAITGVLSAVRLCLGGLIQGKARQTEFMAYLARFGARCYESFDPCCTHLVVLSAEDRAIKEVARFRGVHIVPFEWVIESCICYRRMDEAAYRVPGVESPTRGKTPIAEPAPDRELSSCESVFNTTSSEEFTRETSDDDEEEEREEEADFEPDAKFSIEIS